MEDKSRQRLPQSLGRDRVMKGHTRSAGQLGGSGCGWNVEEAGGMRLDEELG